MASSVSAGLRIAAPRYLPTVLLNYGVLHPRIAALWEVAIVRFQWDLLKRIEPYPWCRAFHSGITQQELVKL